MAIRKRCFLLVASMLVALMALSLLAGCGAKEEKKETDSSTSGKVEDEADLAWPTAYFDNQRDGRSPYSGPATLEVRWTCEIGAVSRAWSVIGKDGTVICGATGKVLSVNPADGTIAWEFPVGESEAKTCAIGDDGTIYTSAGNTVYALSEDGQQKWTYDIGSEADEPTRGDDGTVYVGSTGGKLVALSEEGEQEWEYLAPGNIRSPAIDEDGNLYCGGSTLVMYALDEDGQQKWVFKPEGDLPHYQGLMPWVNTISMPSIGEDGTIYAGSLIMPMGMTTTGEMIENYQVPTPGKLYAITPGGQKKWEYSRAETNSLIKTPTIGKDGTLYAGTSVWKVLAINPADGSLIWEFDTIEDPTECPTVFSPTIGKDGLLYAATTNSRIYCITPQGTEQWHYDESNPWLPGPEGQSMMGGSNNFTPPPIAEDGTLYSLLAQGTVFAFGAAGGGQ